MFFDAISSNAEAYGLDISVHGPNARNIEGGHRIHDNTLRNDVDTISVRDYFDGAVISSSSVADGEIYNNVIIGGCQNGIVSMGGDPEHPTSIHDNTISLKSRYTNGFAIQLCKGVGKRVYNNTINNGSGDNCGIQLLTVEPDTFTCDDLGANTVTLIALDTSANADGCKATVTVEDPQNYCGGQGEYIIGDVNSDGGIDLLDATLINLMVLMGTDLLNVYLTGQDMNTVYEPCGDVNLVDGVTVLDATLVNLYVLMGKDALNAYLIGLGMAPVHCGEPLMR